MKSSRLPALAAAVAVLALAPTLVACGEKSEDTNGEAQPFSLTLDFYPNPDHAGIYMAQKLGYFREAGLDVTIQTPSDPAAPIKQVAAGQTDLAISYEPEVVLANEQGLDVVAVGALVDRPLTSMIWLKESKIGGIADLRGKTIATAGIPYQDAYLKTILARANLSPSDVKTVNVGYGLLPAIVGGRAEAMLGGFRNVEGVDLRLRGENPVVTPVDQLGVPTYDELVLVANRGRLDEGPEAIRLFLAALARGTAAAVASPDATVNALLEANRDLDPKLTRAEVDATLPLLSASGRMDPAKWERFIAWMRDNELIAGRPSPSELLSDDYLPGSIPE
ncbi:MAG TPA: ABC transporter substrate-binding protein [Solirubrobacterales bacterium]|nr:ABC transporter substrate-binding protein [Solirubrobacterales bacterium]